MPQTQERLRRLVPGAFWGPDYGLSKRKRDLPPDPEATEAVRAALRHIEVYADHFYRRDVIEAALRVARPGVGAERLAAELERMMGYGLGAMSFRYRGSEEISTRGALSVAAHVSLRIRDLKSKGKGVKVPKRSEALDSLAKEPSRYFVVAPNRRTIADLRDNHGVHAILNSEFLASMDSALMTEDGVERSRRYWDGKSLLVDKAFSLGIGELLSFIAVCDKAGIELVLVSNRFSYAFGTFLTKVYYTSDRPRIPRRKFG